MVTGFPDSIVPVETSDGDLLYTINQIAEAYESGCVAGKKSARDSIAELVEALDSILNPKNFDFESATNVLIRARAVLAKHSKGAG